MVSELLILFDPQVFQNPLFLHPSDGPGSLSVQEKLIGAQNYRSWRHALEIALSTKRKLGFVTGTVARHADDANRAELWDTCNNMIMFVGTGSEIWRQLEKRFALSNESRKYKLHKETYSCEQQGSLKEEQHLFQFLNGLDENFSAIRTQMLLMNPLPSVEIACSMVQQEESQRELFSAIETTALYSKSTQVSRDYKCSICGYKWHPPEKCWEKVGYPVWHYKHRQQSKQAVVSQGNLKPKFVLKKYAANVQSLAASVQGNSVVFTSEQFEQLLKCLPQMTFGSQQNLAETDDEIDHHFAADIMANSSILTEWILDTGATDHMTPISKNLVNPKSLILQPYIRLPNGNTSVISHIRQIELDNNMKLKDVLVVPSFRFSLLSVPKLTRDTPCVVIFFSDFCIIQDLNTKKVMGMGKRRNDLYYLVNVPLQQVEKRFVKLISNAVNSSCLFLISEGYANSSELVLSYSLWHNTLGHVSNSKLKHIPSVSSQLINDNSNVCVTCPIYGKTNKTSISDE
ncbi:uncharacterized protein [Rutidosis leptorrhynchoides]|uniref:uncharacterized protein n=1 Tax=Rutidosis leptorrhynchoides TaxID=125765 RepID=UPI003A99CAE3